LVLGQEPDSVNGGFDATQAFEGQLDDVALYPTALTAARVQAHRQAGIAPGCVGAAVLTASATSGGGPGVASGRAAATGAGRLGSAVATEHLARFCPLRRPGVRMLPT
jgi:hypothetical protein